MDESLLFLNICAFYACWLSDFDFQSRGQIGFILHPRNIQTYFLICRGEFINLLFHKVWERLLHNSDKMYESMR